MALEYEIRIRSRNQVTLPEGLIKTIGAEAGDRLIAEPDPDGSGMFKVRVVRRSYAGLLKGAWGENEDEVIKYVRGEREAWGA